MIKEEASGQTPEEQLSRLFGSFKAEWLQEQLFDLFTEPAYFPELITPRPCLLVGGRGTGKTTALRCLSYEGKFALSGRQTDLISTWPYYGFYYRVNTNRVTAFKGPELPDEQWTRVFAHYFNLIMCDLVFRFLEWYELHSNRSVEIGGRACEKVAASLHLPSAHTNRELADSLDGSRLRFEAYVNNVADGQRPPLSLQGAPIDELVKAVLSLPQFTNKSLFFLLDEYENFEDYQQQVVNTLIKHSGQLYTFKIGVKELGWRRRATLNENEQLIHPADYARINICEKLKDERFRQFALSVCNERISKLRFNDLPVIQNIEALLPGLTEDEEAERLGVSQATASIVRDLRSSLPDEDLSVLSEITPLKAYLIKFWAEGERRPLHEVFIDFKDNRGSWDTRYDNYKHALLYTLRRGKRGIRKYYAGWDVFTHLAASNIRYLLELVVDSFLLHLEESNSLAQPVSQEIQTKASQQVGKKNLSELEGLSIHGAQLTKLLLGLGRVFQIMAADAPGHAPETNQFYLTESLDTADESQEKELNRLLTSAVMHLALLRSPGNKLADETQTREYDYMVHPIFSSFFVFSYRRKRKIQMAGSELLGFVKNPKHTIREILLRSSRTIDEPLPEQLHLFEAYYDGTS